jgi:hypothetical protein
MNDDIELIKSKPTRVAISIDDFALTTAYLLDSLVVELFLNAELTDDEQYTRLGNDVLKTVKHIGKVFLWKQALVEIDELIDHPTMQSPRLNATRKHLLPRIRRYVQFLADNELVDE